jgi:SAM-dependent methyltransferase
VRTDSANTGSIASLYSGAPISTRSFIWLRWWLTPYREIAAALPGTGRVLDLGSGHGLLSLALSMGSDRREIIGSLSGIAMVDILHYLAPDSQAELLREAARVLEPGGILAVREVDSEGGAAAVWNRFYENVATRIGFTQSARADLEFRSVAGWTSMLESAGFDVRSKPCGSALFSDVLFIALRPA